MHKKIFSSILLIVLLLHNATAQNKNKKQTVKQPVSSRALYEKGNRLMDEGKFAEAEKIFSQILSMDSSFYEAYMGRGTARTALSKHQAANSDLNKLLSRYPLSHEAFMMRGMNKLALQDTAAALSDLSASVKIRPEFAKGYFNRGILFYGLGRLDDALTDLNTAINLNRGQAEYYFQRGLIYERMSNFRLALLDYDTVIMIQPDLYQMRAYNNRALCHKFFDNLKGTVDDYSAILKKYPGNTVVLINRAFAYVAMKKGEEACEDFKMAKELGNPKAQSFLDRYCKGLYDK